MSSTIPQTNQAISAESNTALHLRGQISLPGFCQIQTAVENMAEAGIEERGAIFTRREVVDFILDLVGYTVDKPLFEERLLEPSFGSGDFLFAAVERLMTAYRARRRDGDVVTDLRDSLRVVELHKETFDVARSQLTTFLAGYGITECESAALVSHWLHQGDFLLADLQGEFSYVVGNPPYIRQELIPEALIAEYRRRYRTIYDRADIYIPFIERSLGLLAPGGAVGFICADRWMKNRYGGPLRDFVAQNFRLKYYVDMVETPAFHSDVIAYPAITVITREEPGPTRMAFRPAIEATVLKALANELTQGEARSKVVIETPNVLSGNAPWILSSSNSLAVVRRLEADFPSLEEASCKVGIGVATGADQVFIASYEDLDVEADRKLPLVMTRDIDSGSVAWRGYGVLNPFADNGKLVDLEDYPKFAAYIETHGATIRARHVSKKNPANWYRTIDRIYPALTKSPKLLIPDIKGDAQIVYEDGSYYPHHNLYYITSDSWDLHALQAVLKSGIARLFVETYSTKMRGGFLRFQAQYLRRIRLPRWEDVSLEIRDTLTKAGRSANREACDEAVALLYNLSEQERVVITTPKG